MTLPAASCVDSRRMRARQAGWISVELLMTVAAGIAISALAWSYYGDWMQRAENRQKAIVAVWEVSAFAARLEAGPRDVPEVIQDGQGFDLPGNQFAVRGGACLLDAGDANFLPAGAPFQGIVRTCVPCLDSSGGLMPLTELGALACVSGGGLPKRCTTQSNLRSNLPLLVGTARAAVPAATQLRQGIWIPADSSQDAIEIQHYLESDPQFDRLPEIAISRIGDPGDATQSAGLLLCI